MAAMFSCAVVPRGNNGTPATDGQPSASDYAGHEAAFYYSEGFKAWAVHADEDKAMDLLGRAVKADSSYAPALYQMANILMRSDPDKALEYSTKAVMADTANLAYQSQLGRVMLLNGNYDEALQVYTALVRDDSHNAVNYSMLAALYEYNKQPFTAIAILDSAEYKLGRIEELSSQKRQLLIGVRLYDKAIEETNALIADYPYDDTNYMVLGELYSAMGRDSLALASYHEALRIDSTNAVTLLSVAQFYHTRGNDRNYLSLMKRVFELDGVPLPEKIKVFDEITSNIDYYRNNFFSINALVSTLFIKYPTDYRVLDLYATHLIRSGEMLAALDVYKSYIEGKPDTLPPYYAVLDIEAYLQRPDSVAKYSDIALKLFPESHELYLRRGFSLDHMGRTAEAHKVYRQALRRADTDSLKSVIYGIIGDTHHKDGEEKKSFASYRKALDYDPDNNVVLNNYAYYLSEKDLQLDLALEMSSRANELSPSNPTYLDTQAWIYYKLGRFEEAKKLMIQAVTLDRTGSEVLLLHYGDILYELGEYFMARVYWKRALEKGQAAEDVEERLKWPER